MIEAADLHWKAQAHRSQRLLLFVIDASGSMASRRRMRETKAAVWSVLLDLHRQGDQAALLTFRDGTARVVLQPSRDLNQPRRVLERLAVGGATPLALGLRAGGTCAAKRERHQSVQIVLLTDGRANESLTGQDPWQEALAEARRLRALRLEVLIIDTEAGWPRLGRAPVLAQALGGTCVRLEEVLRPEGEAAVGLQGPADRVRGLPAFGIRPSAFGIPNGVAS